MPTNPVITILGKHLGRSMLGAEFAAGRQPSYWLYKPNLGVASGGRMVAVEEFATDSKPYGYGDRPPQPWNQDKNNPLSVYETRLSNYHVGSKVRIVLPEPNPNYFAEYPDIAAAWQSFCSSEHVIEMLARTTDEGDLLGVYTNYGVFGPRDAVYFNNQQIIVTYPNEVYNWHFFQHASLGQCRIKWAVAFGYLLSNLTKIVVVERFERWTGRRWRRINFPGFSNELPSYNGPSAEVYPFIQAAGVGTKLVPWGKAMAQDAYRVSYKGFSLVDDADKFWLGSVTNKLSEMFLITPQSSPAGSFTVTRGSIAYFDNYAVPEIIRGQDLADAGGNTHYCFRSSETVDQRDFWSSSLQYDINPKVSTAPTQAYIDRHNQSGEPTDSHFQSWVAGLSLPATLPFHSVTSSWWDFGCPTWSDWSGDIIPLPFSSDWKDLGPLDVSAIRLMHNQSGGWSPDLYLWYLRFVYEDVGEYRYVMQYEFKNLAWEDYPYTFKPLARTPGTETYTITDVDDGQNKWQWHKYRKSDWVRVDFDSYPSSSPYPELHATAVATVLGYFPRVA